MAGSNENGGQLPNASDERPTRGACRMVKTSRIVRLTQSRIKVVLDPKHGSATSKSIHNLLAHDVGAVIRQHCPMDDGYWTKMSEDKKKDLILEITVNFDMDTNVYENYDYINKLMATRYREFKCELHDYFLEFRSPEEALANPPIEMDARPGQWESLCEHFQSDRFLRQSNANKINRGKRPYVHHAGSCPLRYIVEECAEAGSQFPEIDTFERAYGGKNKNITNDTAKAKFDEMIAKRDDYIKEFAHAYPEDTPLEEIIVTDKDAGLKIVTDVLGVKLGKDICGLGAGRVRELKGSSMRTRQLEEELTAEKAAKEEAQQSLALFMQRMERWEQTMQQLAQQVPGLIIPPPMIVPPQTNSDRQVGEEEEKYSA